MSTTAPGRAAGKAIGAPLDRIDGPQKVTGTAPYAYDHHVDNPLYLYPLHSDIARGRVTSGRERRRSPARRNSRDHHQNAPRLADTRDKELAILQSDEVAFRGQYIGAVVAETFEVARHAAQLVEVSYEEGRTTRRSDRTGTTCTPLTSSTPASPPTPKRATLTRRSPRRR